MKPFVVALAVTVVLVSAAQPEATAALLVYEGFGYPPGGESLVGKGGAELGYGGNQWGPSWGFCNHQTSSENLSYLTLDTAGGSALKPQRQDIGAMATRFLQSNLALEGTTLWASFLVRREQEPYVWGGVTFGTSNSGGDGGLFVNIVDTAALETVGGGGRARSAFNTNEGETYLAVVEMVFQPGNDLFRLYMNPHYSTSPGSVLAEKTDIDMTSFVQTGFSAAQTMTIDELRIGETYGDVVPGPPPVPEPSTLIIWSLLGALGFSVAWWRRRKAA